MKGKATNKDLVIDSVVFISIVILIMSAILVKPLGNLDELWNYNFAKNIAEGRLPYKDFNMIQMPLLPIICAFFLKVIANELIVMRLLAIILNSLILFMVYKIMTVLKINKKVIFLFLMSIYLIYYNYFCIDYNYSILLIALTGIYLELNFSNKNTILKSNIKHDIGVGVLIGTSILLKQTTGLFISAIFVFYKLLIISKKIQIKEIVKIISLRLIGIFIPIGLLLSYLILNNIWWEFLDYAIYGIRTFSNKIEYAYLIKNSNLHIKVLSILVPFVILYMYLKTVVKTQKTKEDNNIFILFCYSVGCFIVVFPISDVIHFLIGSMPAIISFVYIIYIRLIKKERIKEFVKKYIKAFFIIITIVLLTTSIVMTINYLSNYKTFSKSNHYKFISTDLDKNILKMDSYIIKKRQEGKKVYILDASACLYMIPLDEYNKNYDMFLKGNLGSKGEAGQIENLQNEENIIVLIKNEKYLRNWQNPEQVRKYIIENWSKKGEINQFDIYEKE